jgi:hypothetical protein
MRITTITVALILISAFGTAARTAPATTEEQLAKAKLEPLRKRLPEVLTESVNKSDRWLMKYEATVESLRLVGPTEAKLTVRLEALSSDRTGAVEKVPISDEVLVIYLTFYDGAWTTRRFDGTWNDAEVVLGGVAGPGAGPGAGPAGRIAARGTRNTRAAKFLLAAIDKVTE